MRRRGWPALPPWGQVRTWLLDRGLDLGQVGRRLGREVFGNPSRDRAVYVLVILAWVSLVAWGRLIAPLAITPYFRPQARFQVIAFFENGAGSKFVDSLPTLKVYSGLFDTVSPFWHSVGADGRVAGDGYRGEVVSLARARGLSVVPLVSNVKSGAGNSFEAIRTPEARAKTVGNLVDLVAEKAYDGLNLGFELLPADARESYSTFLRELAVALHGRGKTLAVSVFGDVDVSPLVSGFLDYRAIGEAADLVVLLGYDRSWPATSPGPLAPLAWVEANIDSLLGYLPAGKLILGIGTHAYDWPIDPEAGRTDYLSTSAALARASDAGAAVQYDPVSRQSFYTYTSQAGADREVWLQDGSHVADKVQLAKSRGLRGVAIWRLGFGETGALEKLGGVVGRRP